MYTKSIVRTLLIFFLYPMYAFAEQDSDKDAFKNMGKEFSHCYSVYKATAEYMKKNNQPKVSENYKGAANGAYVAAQYMYTLAYSKDKKDPIGKYKDLVDSQSYGMYTSMSSDYELIATRDGKTKADALHSVKTRLEKCVSFHDIKTAIINSLKPFL